MSDDARLTQITADMATLYAEVKDISIEGLTEAERANLETRVLCVTENLEMEYGVLAFGNDVPFDTQSTFFALQRFLSF
jgi:hypothetical protein